MRSRRAPPPTEADAEEVPWMSFSDAVTALLFVFIATTFWFMFRLESKVQQNTEQLARLQGAEVAASTLLHGVNLCLNTGRSQGVGVRSIVEESTHTLSLYIESDSRTLVDWFGTCSVDISWQADQVVDLARGCLARSLPAGIKGYTVTLTLEGHTDAGAPAGSCRDRFPSNWELSGARAGAALRRLLCEDGTCEYHERVNAGTISRLAQKREDLQIVAAGRADSVPPWRAICDQGSAWTRLALDRATCKVLTGSDFLPHSVRVATVQSPISAALGKSFYGRTLDSPDLALRAWAADPECMQGRLDPARCAARLGLARRVDLRVDFVPTLPTDVSRSAAALVSRMPSGPFVVPSPTHSVKTPVGTGLKFRNRQLTDLEWGVVNDANGRGLEAFPETLLCTVENGDEVRLIGKEGQTYRIEHACPAGLEEGYISATWAGENTLVPLAY